MLYCGGLYHLQHPSVHTPASAYNNQLRPRSKLLGQTNKGHFPSALHHHPPFLCVAAHASNSLKQCCHVSIQYCLCHPEHPEHTPKIAPKTIQFGTEAPSKQRCPINPSSPETSPVTPEMLHTVCRLGSPWVRCRSTGVTT